MFQKKMQIKKLITKSFVLYLLHLTEKDIYYSVGSVIKPILVTPDLAAILII